MEYQVFETSRYRKASIQDGLVEVYQSKGFYAADGEWDTPEISFGSSSDKSIEKAEATVAALQKALEIAKRWKEDC